MATPKKPSKRSKSSSTPSGSSRKKPAAKKTAASSSKSSGSTRKAPAKRAASSSTRKAPAKTARKTGPKSGTNEWAKAADAAEAEAQTKTARAAKAEATAPSLRPGRRRSYGRWAAVAGLLAAVVVVIVLIANGGSDDNDTTVADTMPATTASATATSAAATPAPAAAVPAANSLVRTEKCEPIIGRGTANSGQTYEVTSSAKDGDPAGCGEAHDILLSALQESGTSIGDWSCKTDSSGDPIASCTSTGDRSIQAAG